jgi:anti-sigma-K factor RskA
MALPVNNSPESARGLLAWTLVALAAALVVAVVLLGVSVMRLKTENATLAAERDLEIVACEAAQTKLKERSVVAEGMINELGRQLRAKDSMSRLTVVALAPNTSASRGPSAIVVWNPTAQSGLLTAGGLPANSDDQDYQVWVTDAGGGNRINAGVFHVGGDGNAALAIKPDRPVPQAAAFAVSLGKKGGNSAVDGPLVLEGKL